MKNKKPKKQKEISDRDLFLAANGLTPQLVQVGNEQLLEEFAAVKKELGVSDDEDDENVYRSFVGHKIAFLQNVVSYLLRGNEKIQNTLMAMLEP